jgi:hypothetical protein
MGCLEQRGGFGAVLLRISALADSMDRSAASAPAAPAAPAESAGAFDA